MKKGFTLVELAIVFVIIGLIIGGILVAQDMIKSAEIRGTIGQWESFNTAQSMFKDKYDYIPGDINQHRASEFGFFDRTTGNSAGRGDENGILGYCDEALPTTMRRNQSCERLLFWRDLNDAELIKGYFQSATATPTEIATEDVRLYFPETTIGRGNYWSVLSRSGDNLFSIGGITGVTAAGMVETNRSITPFEAFNIDRKIDDSRPNRGYVRAYDAEADGTWIIAPATAALDGIGACVVGADNVYNQSTEDRANISSCRMLGFTMR